MTRRIAAGWWMWRTWRGVGGPRYWRLVLAARRARGGDYAARARLARLLREHAEAEEQARAGDAAAERLAGPQWPPGSDRRRP